jgi:hypothetical protein
MDGINYKKLGLVVKLGKEDEKAINSFVNNVIPLFKGMTLFQIEQALLECQKHFKSGYVVK